MQKAIADVWELAKVQKDAEEICSRWNDKLERCYNRDGDNKFRE